MLLCWSACRQRRSAKRNSIAFFHFPKGRQKEFDHFLSFSHVSSLFLTLLSLFSLLFLPDSFCGRVSLRVRASQWFPARGEKCECLDKERWGNTTPPSTGTKTCHISSQSCESVFPHRGQSPQNRDWRLRGRKPPFPTTPAKRMLSQENPISIQGITVQMGISWLRTCFSGVGGNRGFSDHKTEKKKAYTTTTKRLSFEELFWCQRKTFQAGGGYKNPIKIRKTISTTEIFPLWPPFFRQSKVLLWSRAVYAFFFPAKTVTARDVTRCCAFFFSAWKSSNFYFACSPEEFCECFFSCLPANFALKNGGDFRWIFFWSPSPTKRSTKSPRKIRGKFGAKFGAKFGTKSKFGKLSFCNFSDPSNFL